MALRRRRGAGGDAGEGVASEPVKVDEGATLGRGCGLASFARWAAIAAVFLAAAIFRRWAYGQSARNGVDFTVRSSRPCRSRISGGLQITGLVEARNIEPTAGFFLGQLAKVVDSVVVLDDHSTDRTVETVLEIGDRLGICIDVLQMTGEWRIRQEMQNRNRLLFHARATGATHFVLLDYDEYISPNCAGKDGTFRRLVSALKPGQSLLLPWVETWRSARYQRLVPGQTKVQNFLDRRQIVIFADNGKFSYDQESSLSRSLGTENSTIHTLKCPRTICPRLKGTEGHPNVHHSQACYIIEMKAIDMDNLFLKSAWYEALGRVHGVPDGTTSGGIMKFVDPIADVSTQPMRIAPLLRATELPNLSDMTRRYLELQQWRIDEILQWIDQFGKSAFTELPTFNSIDWDAIKSPGWNSSAHGLTFIKKSRLIIAIPAVGRDFIGQLMSGRHIQKLPPSDFSEGTCHFEKFIENVEEYENRRHECEPRYRSIALDILETDPRAICHCYDVIFNELVDYEISLVNIEVPEGWSARCADPVGSDNVTEIFAKVAARDGLATRTIESLLSATLTVSGAFALLQALNVHHEDNRSIVTLVDKEHRKAVECNEGLHFKCGPEEVKVAKLVFSANAGRSGSKYLSAVFGTVVGPVIAEHEPTCPSNQCPGGSVSMQFRSLQDSYTYRRAIKKPMIELALSSLASHRGLTISASQSSNEQCMSMRSIYKSLDKQTVKNEVVQQTTYLETNPNFKSWFHDLVYEEFGQNYDVLVLVVRRHLPSVVRSLAAIGWFSTKPKDYTWIETLESVNSPIQVSIRDGGMDAVGKLTSYIVFTEAVIQWMMREYRSHFRFVEKRSEDLFTRAGILHLLEHDLRLVASAGTREIAGQQIDKRGPATDGIPLGEVESSVEQYLKKWKAAGNAIPDMGVWLSTVE